MLAATLLLTLLGLFLLSWFLWGVVLALGLRFANVEWNTGQIVKTVTVCALLSIGLGIGVRCLGSEQSRSAVIWAGFCVETLLLIFVIMYFLRTNFWRAALAFLPTTLVGFIFVLLISLWLIPHFCSTYSSVSNLMAPTILGPHLESRCETCDKASFGTAPRKKNSVLATTFICHENFHVTKKVEQGKNLPADMFLVSMLAKPNRWDIVAYRTTSNDSQMTLGRVVGLPGETIKILEGQIFANGNVLEQPSSIENLKYGSGPELFSYRKTPNGSRSRVEKPNEKFWGSESNPARLGDAEYFLLAENSDVAVDSRNMMEFGGSSNAISESDIMGVVACIYWPINRWAIFR